MAEKTEAPTPHRREEARRKGQGIGRSWEFSMGLTLGVAVLGLNALLPGMANTLLAKTQTAIVDLNPHASNAELLSATGSGILTALTVILPLALLVMIAGIAGNLVSSGLMFSFSAIRFDLNRINPISGMKRLFDKHALVRLGLAAAKLAILALLSWQVVGSRVPAMVASSGSSAGAIAATCLSALFQLGLTITVLLAVVALADFVVQRRWAAQSIRMTKQEVRQEWKEQEGDPLIRSQRRRRARQLAFARMMDAIPTADVVVTNPTTLAVALKYDSLTMRAPKIVAKGQRLMAERIKQIARKNRVPVIEDKPLARALFSRPIGAEVPTHLYRAVARLLVLVHQARFRVAGRSAARASAPVWAMAGASAGGSARPWWADASASVGSPIAEDEEAARRGRVIEGVATGQSEDAISDRPVARVRRLDEIDDDSVIDVEDEELMQSIADEELTDVSAEELAELDAGQVDESDARWDTPANRGPNDEESPR